MGCSGRGSDLPTRSLGGNLSAVLRYADIFWSFHMIWDLLALLGFLSDRLGSRMITFTSFAILAPSLVFLRFVEKDSPFDIALLCVVLVLVGMCIDLSEPALLVEMQRVLNDMEAEDPEVFGGRGAVAQAFSLENMAHFGGLALGPMVGGFVEFRYGWKVMTLALGVLSAVTAMPMLWLSGPIVQNSWSESADEEMEREPLLPE